MYEMDEKKEAYLRQTGFMLAHGFPKPRDAYPHVTIEPSEHRQGSHEVRVHIDPSNTAELVVDACVDGHEAMRSLTERVAGFIAEKATETSGKNIPEGRRLKVFTMDVGSAGTVCRDLGLMLVEQYGGPM